ncbi:MAG: Lrp/AsnC ligand binding domain-containing protein [Chloroflexi bacterium]|nr:Lrp/AsnC ligand binding domain-containing protein [Chloroflexota bacterium]MCY3697726.1 Lrp/AsnC ligand binding domain-containing protein [Chloroflexota bacterium]MXX32925.1 Lrp/AsnC family transcriptional regulator [Chloroflexota bacterium]MXX81757.1 Lrp/AsnC family transcriptional regulator [Chloroflexota bacterium]MYB21917.1 Lrp/AsnC family transcriptional regulator [Chloroflexota bacterium]
MAVKSYILIETDVGTAKQVALSLGDITHSEGEIKSVELVTGPFDVICLVEAENLERLGSCITDSIQTVAGVKRTTTCLTIQV